MKKQILIIACAVFTMAAATSCTYKTCPTYTQQDQEQINDQETEASRW